MLTLFVSISIIVVIVLLLRQWLLYRTGPAPATEAFSGSVYMAGGAAIAVHDCENPVMTAICMHGFCANMGYFTDFYSADDIQLITLNSCGYHLPVDNPRFETAEWLSTPSAAEGSISYDAAVLLQALEHLPRSKQVRVHGHSRGGAVVLEAARQRPDLFKAVDVVLEAPVLPGTFKRQRGARLMLWCMPFIVHMWRLAPINKANLPYWGKLDDPRKVQHIKQLPYNPKQVKTMVDNLRSLADWVDDTDHAIYAAVHQGTVLIAAEDRILDPAAMRRSASAAPSLALTTVEESSHFVLFDRPDTVPAPQI